ncbi:hypothetical protein [Dictyobacter kobayashii]|uniref:Uncharacterized protein n=1 Tax=Dictyobacter kobayashii TaxID=2014872 RepID=A0A402AIH9_9CHLR|nr:hypothetical protein [Dictyobacter kobayashii]GCE18927.1 hypothetical protein KDK_27270 [Dictyobacter kobayashii]
MPINDSYDGDKKAISYEETIDNSNNDPIEISDQSEQDEVGAAQIKADQKPADRPKNVIPKRPSAKFELSSPLKKEEKTTFGSLITSERQSFHPMSQPEQLKYLRGSIFCSWCP